MNVSKHHVIRGCGLVKDKWLCEVCYLGLTYSFGCLVSAVTLLVNFCVF